ncbi:hypothetical protein D3C73_1265510 [compost metagenome]
MASWGLNEAGRSAGRPGSWSAVDVALGSVLVSALAAGAVADFVAALAFLVLPTAFASRSGTTLSGISSTTLNSRSGRA